jgi:hypothetical protein
MNLIILGIMALCGASLKRIAVVAIILGGFDLLKEFSESISGVIDDYNELLRKKEKNNENE